jgi:hypothetical protein
MRPFKLKKIGNAFVGTRFMVPPDNEYVYHIGGADEGRLYIICGGAVLLEITVNEVRDKFKSGYWIEV